jgi:hypothetical protein
MLLQKYYINPKLQTNHLCFFMQYGCLLQNVFSATTQSALFVMPDEQSKACANASLA